MIDGEWPLVGLTGDEQGAVELLALGEPLRPGELAGLTSEHALLGAEARGLLELRGDDVRLAHPLYGEAVRLRLPPLRVRASLLVRRSRRPRLRGVCERCGATDA